MNDLIVENGYPESDHIDIIAYNNGWNITVYRGDDGETYILITDNHEGSQTTYTLGKEGYQDYSRET